MERGFLSLFISALLLAAPLAAADRLQDYEGLIVAAPLPQGYEVTREEVKDGDKVLANRLIITKENVVSKILITIQTHEIPTDAHRVTAVKAYINAMANTFGQAGWKLTDKDIPDITNLDFSKPIVTRLKYENAEKNPIHVHLRIFFTKLGYRSVTVIATSDEDLKLLNAWAASVAEKSDK